MAYSSYRVHGLIQRENRIPSFYNSCGLNILQDAFIYGVVCAGSDLVREYRRRLTFEGRSSASIFFERKIWR